MAQSAAKALKEITRKPVYLLTSEPLRSLAEVGPVLDGVLTHNDAVTALEARYPRQRRLARMIEGITIEDAYGAVCAAVAETASGAAE
jgi:hypothetical protein